METIRCCIACILPCGALDVIRIVHANGRVEEICGSISAGEIMRAYPKHVVRKPPSACAVDGGSCIQRSSILPPSAELQRGKIYFLVPVSTAAPVKSQGRSGNSNGTRRRRKKKEGNNCGNSVASDNARLLDNERYLSEILTENKASTHRDRRRGRVAVWRPHLESITEDDFWTCGSFSFLFLFFKFSSSLNLFYCDFFLLVFLFLFGWRMRIFFSNFTRWCLFICHCFAF